MTIECAEDESNIYSRRCEWVSTGFKQTDLLSSIVFVDGSVESHAGCGVLVRVDSSVDPFARGKWWLPAEKCEIRYDR